MRWPIPFRLSGFVLLVFLLNHVVWGAQAPEIRELEGKARTDSRAMHELGFRYASGQGVLQNYQTALSWYRKSALAGNAEAQYKLGFIHEKGGDKSTWNTPANVRMATNWYSQAAAQGHPMAEFRLGYLLLHDRQIAKYDLGFFWSQKAAAQWIGPAQFEVGICYYLGHVPAPSPEERLTEAAKWMYLAAENGCDSQAQSYLGTSGLIALRRTNLRTEFGEKELDEARQRAETWKQQNPRPAR